MKIAITIAAICLSIACLAYTWSVKRAYDTETEIEARCLNMAAHVSTKQALDEGKYVFGKEQYQGQANLIAILQFANPVASLWPGSRGYISAGALYPVMCQGNQGQSIFKES